MKRLIRMDERDMVATALEDVRPGDEVGIYDADNRYLYSMSARESIPFGNKIALTDVQTGERVIKYGAVIGVCEHAILTGALVHVHNVKSLTVDIPPAFKKEIKRQMQIDIGEGC